MRVVAFAELAGEAVAVAAEALLLKFESAINGNYLGGARVYCQYLIP